MGPQKDKARSTSFPDFSLPGKKRGIQVVSHSFPQMGQYIAHILQ